MTEAEATLETWQTPPFNRWGFWHVREIVPTQRISRGHRPITELPAAPRDVTSVAFEHAGKEWTFGEVLGDTFTDAVAIVHRGELVYEHYADAGGPDQPHLLMSVSKSLTSALVGSLVDDGLLDTEAEVTSIIPELAGTSFDGATVQHLLDMRTGTVFDESDYDDKDAAVWRYDEVCGLSARHHEELPATVKDFMAEVVNDRPHGGNFEYKSILTDLLGWVAAAAGGARLVDLFSERIWSQLGPEQDADVAVDSTGLAIVNGSICTTARDLARFGLLFLGGGEFGGRRILSEDWVGRLRVRNPELESAFQAGYEGEDLEPGAFYHDCWWIRDPVAGIYAGEGINGQLVYVHGPSDTVVVKFSTWPRGWHDDLGALTEAGVLAVCAALDAED